VDAGKPCKHGHDIEAVLASKPPPIADTCPVLKEWGVCPAGLNCRFGGHIKDSKNVDSAGAPLSQDSDWLQKVSSVSSPVGETNVFDYNLVKQLRSKTYDFSRSTEATKDWSRYVSGATDKPVGSLADFERRPLDFSGKTILAPLTTVGNLPFRRLCVKLGVDITVGEMALSSSIIDGGPSDLSLLRRHESEKFYGVQVAGGDIEVMAKCAQFIDEQVDCDFVDINCGCPLDELHRKGAGSRLMQSTRKLEGVVRCMSTVLKTKPLTLKMRTAHLEDAKTKLLEFNGRIAHQLVPQLEDWGVSAITLHGRTARQRYTKLADWDYVSECSTRIKRNTPFAACGDVLGWEEVEEHRKLHGIDAVMIGRGALMKPWLFTEIKERRHWDISASERFDLLRDFTNFGLEHWGSDARGVENTRRFLLEWLSFSCRYVPIGLLETMPPKINWRPRPYVGRSDLETKLASPNASDWVDISEMFLGKVPDGFSFTPKHKSASYDKSKEQEVDGKATDTQPEG
jgi:tRNA-dihydrouridine synthase 3